MTVDVLYNSSPFNHIVITPTMSHTTYVVTVNEYSGRPFFTGIPLVDVFPDHKMALQQISDKYKPSVRHSAVGLIGMAKDLNSVAIGLIDDVDVTGYMPGGHLVKTVRSVKYVTIPNDSKTSFSQFIPIFVSIISFMLFEANYIYYGLENPSTMNETSILYPKSLNANGSARIMFSFSNLDPNSEFLKIDMSINRDDELIPRILDVSVQGNVEYLKSDSIIQQKELTDLHFFVSFEKGNPTSNHIDF